jgi:hypothetical protein
VKSLEIDGAKKPAQFRSRFRKCPVTVGVMSQMKLASKFKIANLIT